VPGFHTESHNKAPNRLYFAISRHFPISPHTEQKPRYRAKMRLVYWLVLPTFTLFESHHIGISASDSDQSDNALRLAMQSASCQRIASCGKSHIAQCSSSDGHPLTPIFSPVFHQFLASPIPSPIYTQKFRNQSRTKNSQTTPLYAKNFETSPAKTYIFYTETFNGKFILFCLFSIAMYPYMW
jgi:hypothetical protein